MAIHGKYEPKTQSIAIDLGAHLFEDPTPVQFHEMAHFYLSKYTNYGAAYSILNEILLNPHKLVVDQRILTSAASLLHNESYLTQEGIAHFVQAHDLYKKGGLATVKDLEDHLPQEIRAKEALSYIRFALGKGDEFCDKITEKISRLAMNTNLPEDILGNPDLVLNIGSLKGYLSEKSNSPDERFKLLAYAIEKNPEIIEGTDEEICKNAGITYHGTLSNKSRADLINSFYTLTDTPSQLTEENIRVLEGTVEALMPGFESMSIRDANIEQYALRGGRTNMEVNRFLEEARNFRSIFVFNNPETPVPDGLFGYYGFSGDKVVYNGRFSVDAMRELLAGNQLTKIVDTHSFDYTRNAIKTDREFVGANIVWYKNFNDFKIFLEMLKTLKLEIWMSSFAFTDEHNHWFFVLKTQENSSLLHVLTGFPIVAREIEPEAGTEYKVEHIDTLEILKGNEVHTNNFFHDILGVPWQFNLIEMIKDAEVYLDQAKKKIDSGLAPYEPCICGSDRKHKWCHNRRL